jgi:hypothetical protein
VLTRDPGGRAARWQVGRSAFDESAPDVGPWLARVRSVQRELEDALVPIMTGLVQTPAGWTKPRSRDDRYRPRALAVADPLPRVAQAATCTIAKDAVPSSCGYANPRLI